MDEKDEKLIREILNGNEFAMEVLVKKYYDLVHTFIYRNIYDYNVACDLTQDVFIKVMKNINKFNLENGKFRSWILKIAVNTYKDYFKSSLYKQRKDVQDIDNHEVKDDKNVIDIVSKKEESIKIKDAIDKLPNLQREAIILKYYSDLKIKEISNITGSNENTIKSRLFNGIKSLKKLLGGEVYEEDEKRDSQIKMRKHK